MKINVNIRSNQLTELRIFALRTHSELKLIQREQNNQRQRKKVNTQDLVGQRG